MDGESLRAIINFGWMELGFSLPYFCKLMKRHNLRWRRFCAPTSHMSDIVIAEPFENYKNQHAKNNNISQMINWNILTFLKYFLKKFD